MAKKKNVRTKKQWAQLYKKEPRRPTERGTGASTAPGDRGKQPKHRKHG